MYMLLLVSNDYNSFLNTFKALLGAFISVYTKFFESLFKMNYFGLSFGKLLFAFLLLSIVFDIVINALRGRQ